MSYNTVKLGEICHLVNGSAFKSKDFQDEGVPVIKIANVKPNKLLLSDLKCVPYDIAEKYRKSKVEYGDILLTMTGNRMDGGPDSWVGKAALFREHGHYMLNQRLCIVRPTSESVDPVYLSYVLSSWEAQLYFISRSTSSGGQANISPTIINGFEVPLPDLNTQKKIAKVLDQLDRKIRNNQLINRNLQEQAQAIYNNMFIEAKDETWENGLLGDLIIVKYGKDHRKLDSGEYPVYGSGGIMRYVSEYLYKGESVLIPRKGSLNNVLYVNGAFWTVDTMFYTEMKRPNIAKFVYHFVKSKDLLSMNTGSAVPSMTKDLLNSLEITIPSEEVLMLFEKRMHPLYRTMQVSETEIKTLEELRDALIPKLLSGEISVDEITLG